MAASFISALEMSDFLVLFSRRPRDRGCSKLLQTSTEPQFVKGTNARPCHDFRNLMTVRLGNIAREWGRADCYSVQQPPPRAGRLAGPLLLSEPYGSPTHCGPLHECLHWAILLQKRSS